MYSLYLSFDGLCVLYEIVYYIKIQYLEEFLNMARTAIDKLGWIVNLILTIFLGPLVQGINRILRGKVIVGLLWILTGGIFGIGWLIDIITMLIYKDIRFLA